MNNKELEQFWYNILEEIIVQARLKKDEKITSEYDEWAKWERQRLLREIRSLQWDLKKSDYLIRYFKRSKS